MPPNGTTGKSSSTGARGPTGPQGQARSSPAGNAGGKAGSVSRTSSGARGPTGPSGQARSSPAGNAGGKAGATSRSAGESRGNTGMVGTPRGYVSKSAMQRVDREMTPILNRATSVLSVLPAARAANVLNKARVAGQAAAGRLLGAGKRMSAAEKRVADLEKMGPQLNRMKQSEAVRLGKPSNPGKISAVAPQKPFRQLAAASQPMRGRSAWQKTNRAIDDVTKSFGFGTGKMARAKAASAAAGVQESTNAAMNRTFGSDRYKNGGLVSKKGRVPPKGMK